MFYESPEAVHELVLPPLLGFNSPLRPPNRNHGQRVLASRYSRRRYWKVKESLHKILTVRTSSKFIALIFGFNGAGTRKTPAYALKLNRWLTAPKGAKSLN